jgi:hypothetical protein
VSQDQRAALAISTLTRSIRRVPVNPGWGLRHAAVMHTSYVLYGGSYASEKPPDPLLRPLRCRAAPP